MQSKTLNTSWIILIVIYSSIQFYSCRSGSVVAFGNSARVVEHPSLGYVVTQDRGNASILFNDFNLTIIPTSLPKVYSYSLEIDIMNQADLTSEIRNDLRYAIFKDSLTQCELTIKIDTSAYHMKIPFEKVSSYEHDFFSFNHKLIKRKIDKITFNLEFLFTKKEGAQEGVDTIYFDFDSWDISNVLKN